MMRGKIYAYLWVCVSIITLGACVNTVKTQPDKTIGVVPSPTSVTPNAKRLALVIGNTDYENGYGLENPVNDATDMADLLRQAGFAVMQVNNVNKANMKKAIREFGQKLQADTTGLFYFSGHGAQYNGENYLLPLGAIEAVSAPGHLEDETVKAKYVLSVMEESRSRTNIVILDACRDNPFKSLFKGDTPRGFAPMSAPSGTLIAYATRAGDKALDGRGQRNSPYVQALKQELLKPGVQIEKMLKDVRLTVMNETNQTQAPAYYNELNGDFCFVEPCGQAGPSQPSIVVETPTRPVPPVTPAPAITPPVAQSPKTFTNSIGMEFVLIPAGQFMMGSGPNEQGDSDEKPRHAVTIAQPFYMGKYEVTQEQWEKVMGNNPASFKGPRNPVENVSWDEVQEFIKRLNALEKTDKYYLPSEAQWEYAARGGTQTPYSFGDDANQLNDYAWYGENSGSKTHPVGQKKPNPWGLYDMHGNVWEWNQDTWHENYNGAPTDGSAWVTGTELWRYVLRGGSWLNDAHNCRSAIRNRGNVQSNDSLGFRVVVLR